MLKLSRTKWVDNMLEFNKKAFKKNSKYIKYTFGLLLILISISIIIGLNKKIDIVEQDLEEDGDNKITKLVINEVSNNNTGSYSDSNGKVYDWIELYNGTNKDIDLNGYTLSDDPGKIKWSFTETTIKSKEYLVVFLAKENIEGLYTNFGLSKNGGETIVLKDRHSKVVDAVETIKTNKNTSMARTLEGEWQVVKLVTPGYSNTSEGHQDFINSLIAEDNSILINEVLVRNGGQFKDKYNDFTGYVELKNNTNSKISLKEYSLSNNLSEPIKWNIPDISLNAGEVIIIYTSGRDITKAELHTSFKLDSKNGVVVLSKNGKIVQKVEYNNLANGYALSLVNGEYIKTGVLTGGYNNNIDGIKNFAKNNEKIPSTLIINEIMNNNYSYLVQNSANYYDWIELKNNSSETIKLSDYYLTTTLNEPEMYQLPDVELKKGEYYIIMASGNTNLSNKSYNHANFKLSNVESLYITSKNKVMDSMFISNIPTGYSFGRDNNFGYVYMSKPSPKANNNEGKYDVSNIPEFSVSSGVYNKVDKMIVEINAPGTIYYTLNGDNPTTKSKKYTGPLTVSKTTVVKAISVEANKYNSKIANASYIVNENHTLPVMSVAIDNSSYKSVVSNAWGNTEKEAYASFFENGEGFEIPCGFQLFGGSTRGLKKKSFALKFKKRYGVANLEYQVFDNRDNSVYNSLVLRSGSQDYNVSMIRDPVMTSLMEETSVDVQAMKPIILYINGSYWGIYYLDEKVDEDFVAAHYNVTPEKTNMMVITGANVTGSRAGFDSFIKYLRTHDMSKKENYEYIKKIFNIDNMIEFWVAETYITNNDILNCKFFSHPDIDNGKWHFIFFDLDYAMYHPTVNYYTFMNDSSGMGSMKVDPTIPKNMLKNAEFRKRFVEILSTMLKTTWSEKNVIEKINYYHDLLEPEMKRNVQRWGSSMSEWEKQVERLRDFARKRKSYLLNQTKSYFGLSNAEMKVFYE